MPIATIVAMKPTLQQSALIAEQRLAGTILGAAVAALFLMTVHNKYAVEAVIIVLGALSGAISAVNYALGTAASAGFVLIAADLPHPSNLAEEGRRVLFTFIGVGIAVVVLFLANLLQKHTAKAAPQPPKAPSPDETPPRTRLLRPPRPRRRTRPPEHPGAGLNIGWLDFDLGEQN